MAIDSDTGRASSGREHASSWPSGWASGWVFAGRTASQIIGGLAIVAGVTFVCFHSLRVNATSAGFAYLLAVLLVATLWGLVESVMASVAAVVCLNFFFLPPIFT